MYVYDFSYFIHRCIFGYAKITKLITPAHKKSGVYFELDLHVFLRTEIEFDVRFAQTPSQF